jgi:hypothetical protein
MQVDWNWIKQRPHFIAELLDKQPNYTVDVFYLKSFRRKLLVQNECSLKHKPISLPGFPIKKFILISKLNRIIEKLFFSNKLKKYDLIYITSPVFYPIIKKIQNKRIIYDCMDDMLSFSQPEKGRIIVERYEKELIKKAYLTLFSSQHLQKTVQKRMHCQFNSLIINNAINIPEASGPNSQLKSIFTSKDKKIISYIGTIADWFDYELLVKMVRQRQDVVFYLFGPGRKIFPEEPGIFWRGPQRHDDVFYIMEKSDALIMPFQVTELVKSVNPVKLYEYIFSGKPVISVKYEETEVFQEYVYLYDADDSESLMNIFNMLKKNQYGAKKPFEEMRKFALLNTWEKRIEQLIPFIDSKYLLYNHSFCSC